MFAGFESGFLQTTGASIFARHGGEGPAVLLLHGHPRTSATWHIVAPRLVERGFTVVCPDLRGYGRSRGPAPRADHAAHSKRAVAMDMLEVMHALGHDRFAIAGHDRGSYVALRLALDYPQTVVAAAFLDGIPIIEHLSPEFAAAYWHWFFFAQPKIPERVINADPIRGTEEIPTLVLWSERDDLEDLHGDPLAIWTNWTNALSGHAIDSGHHMAEDNPSALTDALASFLTSISPPTEVGGRTTPAADDA